MALNYFLNAPGVTEVHQHSRQDSIFYLFVHLFGVGVCMYAHVHVCTCVYMCVYHSAYVEVKRQLSGFIFSCPPCGPQG